MELNDIIKKRDLKNAKLLISDYIDSVTPEQQEQLVSLYNDLTLENASLIHDKASNIIFRPIIIDNPFDLSDIFYCFLFLIGILYLALVAMINIGFV